MPRIRRFILNAIEETIKEWKIGALYSSDMVDSASRKADRALSPKQIGKYMSVLHESKTVHRFLDIPAGKYAYIHRDNLGRQTLKGKR